MDRENQRCLQHKPARRVLPDDAAEREEGREVSSLWVKARAVTKEVGGRLPVL